MPSTLKEAVETGTVIARAEQRTIDVCYWQITRNRRFYYTKRSTDPLREHDVHYGSIHCDGRFERT